MCSCTQLNIACCTWKSGTDFEAKTISQAHLTELAEHQHGPGMYRYVIMSNTQTAYLAVQE